MSGRVLVTGGGRGLGAAIVRALAGAGHDLLLTYRSAEAEAAALVAELQAAHPACAIEARRVDLADRAALDAFCETIEGESFLGLVHNAGQPYDALAAVMVQERAEAVMQVNFWSFTRLAKALMRGMVAARSGRVVAIGSIAAERGNPGNAAYAASKGALAAYSRTLSVEVARRGVTVNVVAPGFVDTEMLAPYANHRAQLEAAIPGGRFARVEEVAALVAFLMSPAAAAITGVVLPVDGGLSAALGARRP